MVLAAPADASARHLAGRLGLVADRVRLAVERRRAGDPDPDDRFRGLYVSDAQVDHLLAGGHGPLLVPEANPAAAERRVAIEREADAAEAAGDELRLRRLARTFELGALDVELLLVALAPDLDPRFERLYGYLHDDVSRRRASIGLALELAGVGEAASSSSRSRTGRS
jgi:Winged helix domain, variant